MKDKNGTELKIDDWVILCCYEIRHIGQIVQIDEEYVYLNPVEASGWYSYRFEKITEEQAMIYMLEN